MDLTDVMCLKEACRLSKDSLQNSIYIKFKNGHSKASVCKDSYLDGKTQNTRK